MNNINVNQLERAEELVNDLSKQNIKVIKKEKGLIERVEDSKKVIIVEDNRQLICE